MPANEEIIDAVAANLAQPQRARTEAGEVEQHELDHQVMAARFVMNARAGANPFACLRFARTEAPGATG